MKRITIAITLPAVVASLIAVSGCGGNGGGTETDAAGQTDAAGPTITKADPRPLFGPCSDSDAAGVDGLSCADADQALAAWPKDVDAAAVLRDCPHERAGSDHRAERGITCGRVDQFVGGIFAPHPAGWVERADGVTCHIVDGDEAALEVSCREHGRWFTFGFS